MLELTPSTAAGAALVEVAERLASDLAGRAAAHDREASYPFEGIEALRESGYLVAPVPVELGGLGVASLHDLVVAAERLARGDASLTIGANMHNDFLFNLSRRWRVARAGGDERRAAAYAATIEPLARGGAVVAAAISERGQDLLRPSTRAVRTPSGWRIDGHKVFCTMSPAATILLTAVGFQDERGRERYGYAMIPAEAPGVTVLGDWDALGMRASGSHSVSFEAVEVGEDALRGGFPAGEPGPYLARNLTAGLFHASASLGIAESAHATAIARVTGRGSMACDSRTSTLSAESTIDLAACRALLARAARLIDEHEASTPGNPGAPEQIEALFCEAQAAKTFIGEAAARVVDRALALSGGAGYVNGSPLARAYRDVRAGAFMHPLGANRAYEFIGRFALGMRAQLS